jgi:hypothetical protein
VHPIDQALSFPAFKSFLFKVGLTLAVIAFLLVSKPEVVAALGGYALFSGNIYLLAYLAKLVFTIVGTGTTGKARNNSGLIGLIVIFKFTFLAVSLYLMIVTFELSGIAIFIGSLVSVFSISAYLSVKYMEYLAGLKVEQAEATNSAVAKEVLNPQVGDGSSSYGLLVPTTPLA